jgi:hypothetical protein
MGEYITPTEVDELDLPRFHWIANRRKIGELAAQVKGGRPELADRHPKNRLGLRLLANSRQMFDRLDNVRQEQGATLKWADESLLAAGVQVGEDPEQLVININGE